MSLAILFNITGAFDNIKWDTILEQLKLRNSNRYLFELVSSLTNRSVKLEDNLNPK